MFQVASRPAVDGQAVVGSSDSHVILVEIPSISVDDSDISIYLC